MDVDYAGLIECEKDETDSEDEEKEEDLEDIYAKYGISANAGK